MSLLLIYHPLVPIKNIGIYRVGMMPGGFDKTGPLCSGGRQREIEREREIE